MSAGVSTQLKIVKRQSGPDSMDGKQINNLMGNRNNVADLQSKYKVWLRAAVSDFQ